jgi:hypothetical protein
MLNIQFAMAKLYGNIVADLQESLGFRVVSVDVEHRGNPHKLISLSLIIAFFGGL